MARMNGSEPRVLSFIGIVPFLVWINVVFALLTESPGKKGSRRRRFSNRKAQPAGTKRYPNLHSGLFHRSCRRKEAIGSITMHIRRRASPGRSAMCIANTAQEFSQAPLVGVA